MHTVNIHDAKTRLSALLARVDNGETITIARAGKPIADLVPHPRPSARSSCRTISVTSSAGPGCATWP
jgi:prevent-host-death family protein